MKIGVLGLQGAARLHHRALRASGLEGVDVREPAELADVDGLIIPGGESTTIGRLLETSGLAEPLAERLDAGMPVLGTCAGMILLAADVVDGRAGQRSFGSMDLTVRRNGYGRQVHSFEADLEIAGIDGGPFRGVFVRAPVVERVGDAVTVLASLEGRPVLCRQGPALVAAFHPELTADARLHEYWVSEVVGRAAVRSGEQAEGGP